MRSNAHFHPEDAGLGGYLLKPSSFADRNPWRKAFIVRVLADQHGAIHFAYSRYQRIR
jgi:hypothetical protein